MILTHKQRSSIYAGLAPVIGEEEAEALLSQFPSTSGDEPVTRDALRAELAEATTQVHDHMRQMAMWMVGAIIGGMGLAATIGSALG